MVTAIKPPYIDPAGEARQGQLPVRPPFLFSGVTARVFPLRANMARLTNFVDAYVNMDIPPEIVQFRPALPYVYLMVLDYGSMSSASMHAQNVGWVAQHEVAFTLPLQRWQRVGGRMVFRDWACVSPFIFVDDEVSLTTGREVYGWPKVAGSVDAVAPMWDHHPRAASRLFTFSTAVFPHVYAGQAEAPRVLLQIDADPQPTYSEFPPDPGNAWAPWSLVAQAARSSISLAGQTTDLLLGLRARGFRHERSLASLRAMAGKALGYMAELGPALWGTPQGAAAGTGRVPRLAFDNITVKQFRDAQEPERACYKALVRSSMGVERINRGGLLGDANLLRGDLSGGYSIRVHRYVSQPIIQTLGIDVAATESTGDGSSVAVLRPVFPFWNDVDLFYGAGEPICSRTYAKGVEGLAVWVDEQPLPPPELAAPQAEAGAEPPPNSYATMPEPDHAVEVHPADYRPVAVEGACYAASGDYNTALGAATQPVAGPFHFPDVTQQVFPLLADREALDAFVQHYLNEPLAPAGLRFETMGSYAYLMVNVIGDQAGTMWSATNDIGWWAEREVSFCVPVRCWRRNEQGEDELLTVALVAPFVYASNSRAVITDREVNGRPSWKAEIDNPADAWLESSGPARPRRYLHMSTEVFPALGYGQKAEQRTLLEIDGHDVLGYTDEVGWRLVGERWGHRLMQELMRKHTVRSEQGAEIDAAMALGLEILAHGAPVNWLVFKQYRDAADVSRACYQALVLMQRSIKRIYDIREIEERVHVRLHRFPGHPIVQTLGLRVKSVDSSGGQVVQNLQPMRPFWMRVSVREELGTVLAVRRPDGSWHTAPAWLRETGPDLGDDDVAAGAPYFRAARRTRVQPAWGTPPQRLREHQSQLLRQALASSLQGARAALAARPAAEQAALRASLPGHATASLADLEGAADALAWAGGREPKEMLALEHALELAGLDWQAADPALERLSRADAAAAIARLDDVQLVVEGILGAEWEHWGNPRYFQGLPPKPEPCVPAKSLEGGAEALRACAPPLPAGLGIQVTDDGTWCYVAGTAG